MKRDAVSRWVGWGVGLCLFACGGSSTTSFDDEGSGGDPGDTGGTGGSVGGSTATGGTAGTGSGKGGSPQGGSAGTGGTVEPPDGVCEDITACGGDPSGTWAVTENCTEIVLDLGESLGCDSIPAAGSATIEGTFTFADGMLTQDTIQTVLVTMTIDDACAQALTTLPDVTAADVCPLLNVQLMMDPMTPGSCAVVPDGCRCDVTQAPEPNTMSEPYEVVGNQILVTSTDTGTTSPIDFCQEGDVLHLHSTAVDVETVSAGSLTILLERN